MKKVNLFFLFIGFLLISCNNQNEELLLENDFLLVTKSNKNSLSKIPEFEGSDLSKREMKILKNGIMIEYVNGNYCISGDISLTDDDIKLLEEIKPVYSKAGVIQFNSSIINPIYTWPKGIIPYVIESGHAYSSAILQAMQEWSSKTSIEFVPYTNQNQGAYLYFMKNAGKNESYVGRRFDSGYQNIWINSSNPGIAMHEIGHAIGLIHEHQRSDASQDIIVYENNIKPDWVQWFRPYSLPHYCLNRFNYNSIMSYGSDDCLKDGVNGYSMVKREDGSPWFANRSYVSTLDIVAVEYFYNTLIPVYRYYGYISSSRTNDHYYGLEEPQGNNRIIKNQNYTYEYLEFYMPENISGTTPLKRYYNSTTKNHSFYPYNGYTQDTQIGYIFTSKRPGTVELREYKNIAQNTYHYVTTLSEEEWMNNQLSGQYQFTRRLGWVYPGRGDGRD